MPHPPPGDLPASGTEPGSPALQAGSSPSEPPGKPPAQMTAALLSDGMGVLSPSSAPRSQILLPSGHSEHGFIMGSSLDPL